MTSEDAEDEDENENEDEDEDEDEDEGGSRGARRESDTTFVDY